MNPSTSATPEARTDPAGNRFVKAAAATPRGPRTLTSDAIARAKQGDIEALHFIYLRYADDVFGYVLSIVRDQHEAEDITQGTFAKLTTAIRKYEPRDVPFTAWILRVARNATLDHMRSRRTIPFADVRGADEGHDEISHERYTCLRDALDQVPAEQREVLALRHIVGLSPGEIALKLDKSEGSVHGLHHRGRATLQEALRELDAAPLTMLA